MNEELKKELEQLKAALETSITEKQKKEIGDTIKSIEEQVKALEAKIPADSSEQVSELKTMLTELKEEFVSYKKEAGKIHLKGGDEKPFFMQLKEGIESAVKSYKENGKNAEVQLKTAITSSNFTNDTTNNTRVIAEMREQGINKTPKRSPWLRSLAFNGSTSSDTISWTEKVSETGVPIPLAELDAYPEETTTWQQFSTSVKKIGGITKVSEEKLDDAEWMLNEIRQELLERHDLVVDSQLLSGAGTGNNLKGVQQYAQAFDAGDFALLVPTPNRADVLRVAYNQIVIEQFVPTFIAMHPTDVAFNDLEKDSTGNYIFKMKTDQNTLINLPVVENTGITAGDFLIGDASRIGVFAKGGAVLEIGRDGNDFSTDQVTVKLRERLAARVKGRDVKAFVKGTFSTAITALTKP